MQQDR